MLHRADTNTVAGLLDEGAQLVDVLPQETFRQEHIPGAVNIPLDEIASAVEKLDRDRPVITYCFDHQCDLSSRAASRLVLLGFGEVYDYVDSKVAWFADGRPSAGLVDDSLRAVARVHRDLPRVGPDASLADVDERSRGWEVVAVVDDDGVLLGSVRAEAADLAPATSVASVMQAGPPTVRPSIPLRELAESMDKDGQRYLLITTSLGRLLGLVRRDEIDVL